MSNKKKHRQAAAPHLEAGTAAYAAGRLGEAEEALRSAIAADPGLAGAHYNLGIVLQEAGRLTEAAACYNQAALLEPGHAKAWNNLGVALQRLGETDAAVACLHRAVAVKPDYAEARSNLIFTLDLAGAPPEVLALERERWDETHARPLARPRRYHNDPDPGRRLRIGYVSADLRDHAVVLACGCMLTMYDRSRFEVYAYSNLGDGDSVTESLREQVTEWRDVHLMTDEELALLIREDRIDVLVDLSGHTAGNRLLAFARSPAPVQVTAWGYPMGTGMTAMDYLVSDAVITPEGERGRHAEEVVGVSCAVGSFPPGPRLDPGPLPFFSNGYVTFGAFNRLGKISNAVVGAWAEVLRRVPRSRLLLKVPEFDEPAARARVTALLKAEGVHDRVDFLGWSSVERRAAEIASVDLALDTFPTSGGVTTRDCLTAGVPVVTLRGATASGRLSASLLTVAGMSDWIARTPDEYVEVAVRKAASLGVLGDLAILREELRGRLARSGAGSQVAYVREAEEVYRRLWRRWCGDR